MTTTPDRAEINRQNSRKSTGPRTTAGKSRSRFNAVKHGCRARLPILPGEDPKNYQNRLDDWIGKFDPRDAVELYLVERAVHVSWQLDRADRAEVARLGEPTSAETAQHVRDVAELGAALFRVPGSSLSHYPVQVGGAGAAFSEPFEPAHPGHPARLVAALEATALGCVWLLEQWAALGKVLDEGRIWRPADRLRAVRLMGKQPMDAIDDESVMAIYLACHAMDPEGPDVFDEALIDLWHPELEAERNRLADRFAAARTEQAPRDAAAGRTALRAIVAAAVARLTELREVRAAAAGTAMPSARPDFDASQSGEWLRRHQATCSRTLFRTFDALRKLRREFGDGPPTSSGGASDEAHAASGQDQDESGEPSGPLLAPVPWPLAPADAVTNEASAGSEATESGDRTSDGGERTAESGQAGVTNEASAAPGATGDGQRTTDNGQEAVTNEASGASDATANGQRTTDNGQEAVTNEANSPAQDADRPVQAVRAVVVALLVVLFCAGLGAAFGASAEGVGPGSSPPGHSDTEKSEMPEMKDVQSSGPAMPRAGDIRLPRIGSMPLPRHRSSAEAESIPFSPAGRRCPKGG